MLSDTERIVVLEAKVADLEAKVAAGATTGVMARFEAKIAPYTDRIVQLILLAVGAWLVDHGVATKKQVDATNEAVKTATTETQTKLEAVATKQDENSVKIDETKAVATMAAQKSDEAVGVAARSHAEVTEKLDEVQKEVAKPKPLVFPDPKKGKE